MFDIQKLCNSANVNSTQPDSVTLIRTSNLFINICQLVNSYDYRPISRLDVKLGDKPISTISREIDLSAYRLQGRRQEVWSMVDCPLHFCQRAFFGLEQIW